MTASFSRRHASLRRSVRNASFPLRRLLDGLQGPAEHGHGRRGRRRRRAARALLLARRLVRGTGAHRAHARVTYWKGRVVVWEHVWRLETGRCASIAAVARSGGVESRARGSATRRANRTSPVPPAVLRRRGVARVVRYAMDVSNRAAGQGAGPDGVLDSCAVPTPAPAAGKGCPITKDAPKGALCADARAEQRRKAAPERVGQ